LLEAASGFLATRAIAGGGQNRPADCLQSHLAASAYLGEVFLLFLVHCDRPFVDPVYEVILALVRNVRNGSSSKDLGSPLRHVRSTPRSRHRGASGVARRSACLGFPAGVSVFCIAWGAASDGGALGALRNGSRSGGCRRRADTLWRVAKCPLHLGNTSF
jgi:hypothetical protein